VDDVELWAVGYSSTIGQASVFGEGQDAACLADNAEPELSAYVAYDAAVDDVFIIDRQGQVRFAFTVGVMNLTESKHRNTVDGWVRELL